MRYLNIELPTFIHNSYHVSKRVRKPSDNKIEGYSICNLPPLIYLNSKVIVAVCCVQILLNEWFYIQGDKDTSVIWWIHVRLYYCWDIWTYIFKDVLKCLIDSYYLLNRILKFITVAILQRYLFGNIIHVPINNVSFILIFIFLCWI